MPVSRINSAGSRLTICILKRDFEAFPPRWEKRLPPHFLPRFGIGSATVATTTSGADGRRGRVEQPGVVGQPFRAAGRLVVNDVHRAIRPFECEQSRPRCILDVEKRGHSIISRQFATPHLLGKFALATVPCAWAIKSTVSKNYRFG